MSNETKDVFITDSQGRKLKLVEPQLLERFDLISLIGGENAANQAYMNLIEPIAWVREIDGERINLPETDNQLKFLIKRIGNAGWIAVQKYLLVMSKERKETEAPGDELIKKSPEMTG